MTQYRYALLILVTLASACSKPEKTGHYLIDSPALARHLPNKLGRVAIKDVALPQYAAGQEIAFQTPDGALRSRPDQIWADDPVHAVTGYLANQISAVSGATAIAEPWPFTEPPQRRVEVRVARMLAGADGGFHLTGQYFVTSDQGGDLARSFDITVPIGAEGPGAIAAAQSLALQKLAEKIAALAS
jgi:hypothetical protein